MQGRMKGTCCIQDENSRGKIGDDAKIIGKRRKRSISGVFKNIFKMVVGLTLMYGMELYWEGQEGMRDMLQKWLNKGMRKILGAVRTTPVDAMLGELGWRRVEYELDRRVERWGMRLLRRGEGEDYGESWKILEKERAEIGRRDWVARMIRGVKKHKLEGEKFELEKEREGGLKWKIKIGDKKEERKKQWEEERREREENWIVGISDASGEGTGIGIGGGWYEEGELKNNWLKNMGKGWTVGEGEMEGVGECLKRVEEEYKGEKRKVIVGVDNKGVLWKLKKGRGVCGEAEQRVRRVGRRLIEKGWEVRIEWVPGHIGIEENEEADEWAKEGSWDDEEDEETKDVLVWGKWEQRRKEFEGRRWKEYWTTKRKGEEYFGTGAGGERGHGGKRWESKFLFWMRTNHGGMGGSRYMKGRSLCQCGGVEDRDHIILYCDLWKKEREEVWKGWWKGVMGNEGWVDMDRLLFGEEGTKRLVEFGKRIGWMERNWEVGRIEGEERRKGMLMKPWKEKGGGWLGEKLEARRREILESARLRMRRLRERRREEARNG